MGGEECERKITEDNDKKEEIKTLVEPTEDKGEAINILMNLDGEVYDVEEFDSNLPKTVSLLYGPNGSKLYLVGTSHFSLQSQEDVSKVIRTVKPHIVVLELCRARSTVLKFDETSIEKEVGELSFGKMRKVIKDLGFLQGMLNILLCSVSAQISKDLGMAPGGEFRKAFEEVKKIPGCVIHFGDRPITITLQRALSLLSWWKRLRLACELLFDKHTFTEEEVEKYKDEDLLASMLLKMSTEYPELGKVFISERDIYLTFSLQTAVSCTFLTAEKERVPTIAVGVVGIGHKTGITDLWMKVNQEDVIPTLVIEQKKSKGILKKTVILAIATVVCFQISKRVNIKSLINNFMMNLRH